MTMMRSSVFVNASARQLHQLISQSQRQRGFKSCTSSINRCNRKSTISPPSLHLHYHPPSPCIVTSDSLNRAYRQQSTTTTTGGGGGGNNMNGESSPGDDIIDSAAATTQWKRNHYQKLEDKFSTSPPTTTEEGEEEDNDSGSTKTTPSSTQQQQQKSQPLPIDNYDDVQPMWKQMESRVTKRRSLTLGQRGGVSGRRNVRKSDEDLWLEAGVYDSDNNKPKDD